MIRVIWLLFGLGYFIPLVGSGNAAQVEDSRFFTNAFKGPDHKLRLEKKAVFSASGPSKDVLIGGDPAM